MRTIYQVVNETGNPASREGNDEAIFLDHERAQAHIKYLHDECGLIDIEFKIETLFDFDSWHETHFEIVQAISFSVDVDGSTSQKVGAEQGTGGLYDLAKELTDKFETLHKGKEWGIDENTVYQDEIEKFLDSEL